MNPKQSETTQLRRDASWAHAPYNFVPLPEQVVIVKPNEIPNQDRYSHHTGYIDCTLTTRSPLYTRSAMTLEFFNDSGEKAFSELDSEKKNERAQFFHVRNVEQPVIPGSSLRGMVRALVEIAGFGKVQWVSDALKITYRAVAASHDDPLAEPYREMLGKFGRNVRAGYLKKSGDRWSIQPAKQPSGLGMDERGGYLKVKDIDKLVNAIPGMKRFNDPEYSPRFLRVGFNAEPRQGERGKYTAITQIGASRAGLKYNGTLVCSGNMLETGGKGQVSPRKNYALVLEEDAAAKPIPISEQVVDDYISSLTPFQSETPFDEHGCLKPEYPVFFIASGNAVIWFGHTPNFRVPAFLEKENRAASPLDFVPDNLRSEKVIDLAEAIFGYVPGKVRGDARAGRVFFTDAKFQNAKDGIWLSPEPITPKILGGPKPTTFQHYLVQDKQKGHDPNRKEQLANYATPPTETAIRGTKLYWHKGEVNAQDISEQDKAKIAKAPKQYTGIKPVNLGVTFKFRIHFENLKDEELGALLWVLKLPQNHFQKLGMGKPLGMGAVEIDPVLHLADRKSRYTKLFDDQSWFEGNPQSGDEDKLIASFEKYVLDRMDKNEKGQAHKLAEVERIKMLLKMLEWPGPDRTLTDYMVIESRNEYKERSVLPDPLHIEAPSSSNMNPPAHRSSPPASRQGRQVPRKDSR